MSQKNRESGFYWVNSGETWEIAEWSIGHGVGVWLVTGWDCPADDDSWKQIDERRITREEPKS